MARVQLLAKCSSERNEGRPNEKKENTPFRTRHDLVEVLSALLAEVLVWAGLFLHDAHAAAVLPDLADVALDEEAAQIIGLDFSIRRASARLARVRGASTARVLLEATHAAGHLVLFGHVVIELVLQLGRVFVVVVLLACAPSCQRCFGYGLARWLVWLL